MKAIVCMTPMNGIGFRNTIPWKSKIDMGYFKEVTTGKGNNAVIMGFNTFRSLGYRALPNRRNYVLTRRTDIPQAAKKSDVVFESNIQNTMMLDHLFDEVYVIGGEDIYKLYEPFYTELYVTYIDVSPPCDRFFFFDKTKFNSTKIKEVKENGTWLYFYLFYKSSSGDELV
jgi:dihydrofolate reductase